MATAAREVRAVATLLPLVHMQHAAREATSPTRPPGPPGGSRSPGRTEPSSPAVSGAFGQPSASRSSLHACSQERQASAQTRQCSCMSACSAHSSPHALQTMAHAFRIAAVMFAS